MPDTAETTARRAKAGADGISACRIRTVAKKKKLYAFATPKDIAGKIGKARCTSSCVFLYASTNYQVGCVVICCNYSYIYSYTINNMYINNNVLDAV